MKITSLIVLLMLGQIGYSQDISRINKRFISKGDESFPPKNYVIEKRLYSDQELVYQINYTYNGWQITDSIVYQKKDKKHCVILYKPQYDFENKIINCYELANINCNQINGSSNDKFIQIKDKYGLSREYLESIAFLLSSNPEKNKNRYQFKDGIMPLLFIQYGIPRNKLLRAFSFSIEGDMIKSDSFMYDNVTLSRDYMYEGTILKEVKITVKNREENTLSQFREVFNLE